MPEGYIQLLANGNEKTYFNDKPQISFFRNAYRRYSNFYIANQELLNNNLQNNNNIKFIVPKDGDLLSKSYIKFIMEENYVELFFNYQNVNNTLTTNILNLYDCFNVKINSISKMQIQNIQNFKLLFQSYFTLMDTNIINTTELLNLINSDSNIILETDTHNYYYNINEFYNFYGYKYLLYQDINNNPIIQYCYSTIEFDKLNYIRIDFVNFKSCFKIVLSNQEYQNIVNYILTNITDKDDIKFKINKYELYFSLNYYNGTNQKTILSTIINMILQTNKPYNITLIDNKINSIKFTTDDILQITKYIYLNDENITYYNINTKLNDITIYLFKTNIFFGNYNNNDFNDVLIQQETTFINNLCLSNNKKLSLNIFIKLFVSIYSIGIDNSIQSYLTFVNNQNKNFYNIASYYANNIVKFNNIILDNLFNPNTLILDYNNLQSILYQKEIKDAFTSKNSTTNIILPYVSKKVYNNSDVILNKYIYSFIVQYINNTYPSAFNANNNTINSLILLNFNTNKNNIILYNNLLYNYNINNFLFNNTLDLVSSTNNLQIDTILLDNNITFLLFYYNLIYLITNSIYLLNNIYNQPSNQIYNSIGQSSEILYNFNVNSVIFPLSSNIYIYSSDNQQNIFNITKNNYLINILDNINALIIKNFNIYKTNYTDDINLPSLDDFMTNGKNTFNEIINNYYNLSISYSESINFNLVDDFLNVLNNVNFNQIYNIDILGFNLNNFVLNNLFDYIDLNMFNKSFSNVWNMTVNNNYGLKFLFVIGTPFYRLYYLFTFLGYMSLDTNLINIMPFDLINLRDLTLKFILNILKLFNGTEYDFIYDKKNTNNYDLSLTNNNLILISNNFICYDNINILNKVKYNINDIYLYNSFFFIENIINIIKDNINSIGDANQINYTNIKYINEIMTNIYNSIKYNYDDGIYNLFISTILLNKKYFKNVQQIINLVNLFFDKSNINYEDVIKQITIIVNFYNQYSNFSNLIYNPIFFETNTYYYNCYYSLFSIGVIFDNTNKLMVDTINNIYATIQPLNNSKNNNYFTIKSYNIKQYNNIIKNNNVIDVFIYFKTLFYNIGYDTYFNTIFFYYNLINEMNKYLLNNLTFINKYIVDTYIYEDSITIIEKYLQIFNNKNKVNISILNYYSDFTEINILSKQNNYVSSRLITIYLLYLAFVEQCLIYDIKNYIDFNSSNIDNINFQLYILNKYSYNIYIQCLNDLTTLYKNNINLIGLDYSTINIFVPDNNYNNTNNLINGNTYFNQIETTTAETLTKELYNIYNIYNQITFSENTITDIYIETDLQLFINLTINISDILTQNNKLLFTIYNDNYISLVDSSVSNFNNNTLQNTYVEYKKGFYENSLNTLQQIYINLYNSYNLNLSIDLYENRIINQIFMILQNYYFNSVNNYFNTMYYVKYLSDVDNQNKTNDLCIFTTTFLNNNILNSMQFERNINRILYYYITQYALKISGFIDLEVIKKFSLYDYVRMYKPIYKNKENKQFETNLSLIQNEQIFQLLNFDNFIENNSFSQNPYFNDLLIFIGTDLTTQYNNFYNFISNINNDILNNFILSNQINVFEYFTLSTLYFDELNDLFYKFITLTEYFSPYHIYNDIIQFLNDNNNISSKYLIDFDNIKKKIVVYLFVMFLIYTNIPNLINYDDLLFNKLNYYLEYNFPNNVVSFQIKDVFNDDEINNIKIQIQQYYQYIYNFDLNNINNPLLNDIQQIKINYINFAINFVNSYKNVIGNDLIYTNSLLNSSSNVDYSISNLTKNINIILNNDIEANNSNSYALTIKTYNTINMYYRQQIYDLNNPLNNKITINSNFINYKKIFFNKTDINTTNLLLNIPITYLNYYNITYDDVNNNINEIINTERYFGKSYINETLELLKGVVNDNFLLNEFISNDTNIFGLIRSDNIKSLSIKTNNSDLEMSIIAPSDYDYDTVFINFNNIFNNQIYLYKKYYYYNYNYYNFPDNYVVVYQEKAKYYQNVVANSLCITTIQNNNVFIYLKMMNDIYYTYVGNSLFSNVIVYNDLITPPASNEFLINIFNDILNLYIKYNFNFRLNVNIPNFNSLKLQTELQNTNNFTNIQSLLFYVNKLYYYELFSSNILTVNLNTVQGDFIEFFNQLKLYSNYNFNYFDWIINYVYRFELIVKILFTFINSYFGNNIVYDKTIINEIIMDLLHSITNKHSINVFIKNIYANYNILNDNINIPYKKINNMTFNDYNDFLERLQNALNLILYYDDNYSITYIIKYSYELYFNNINFQYYTYANNDKKINTFAITLNDYKEIIYDYMTFYVKEFNNYSNLFIVKLVKYINTLNIPDDLVINLSDLFEIKTIMSFGNLILTLTKDILHNNYFGMVYVSNVKYFNNYLLTLQIFYMNAYFITLNNSTEELNITQQNIKLEQLYRINILLILSLNITNQNYTNILQKTLIYANTYNYNDILIDTINETKDISVYFDYLNKNIIPNNKLTNYYKNVQNSTVENVLHYKILSYENNFIENNFITDIYNRITTKLITYNETDIGLLFFNNSIVSIINNYDLESVFNNILINMENLSYVNTIIKNVYVQMYNYLDTYKLIFGDNTINSNAIMITTNIMFNIFNNKQFIFNDNFITIMTFIYTNLSNTISMFNFDIPIILFYYGCLLTFIFEYGNNYVSLNKLIYYFVNLINNNIIEYVNGTNEHKIFFDGLNELLYFKNDFNNFTTGCYTFFNTIIHNLPNTNEFKEIKNQYKIQSFNLKSYNGHSFKFSQSYLDNKILNKFIKNPKINIWKNLLAITIDYNNSNTIKNFKSIMYEGSEIIDIQKDYINHIETLNGGILNKYGLLNMIDYMQLLYGDEIIDKITDNIYKIILDLMTNLNKLELMNRMLGIDNIEYSNGLKCYIKKFNKQYLYLPVKFFFDVICNAIPLIACMHVNINIELYMKNNNIIKNSINVNNLLNMNNYQTSMYNSFYLVEKDERKTISTTPLNNLIEKHMTYTLSKTINNIPVNELLTIDFDFEMTNCVKELIWFVEFSINGYVIENTKNSIYDYLVNVIFYMDGLHRDGVEILTVNDRNNTITTNINKYKYNTRANPDNIYNVYSFAFKPEELQPSGAINMSRFTTFRIELVYDNKKLLNYLGNFNKITDINSLSVKMTLQTLEYNVIAYRSGLAGLGYVS